MPKQIITDSFETLGGVVKAAGGQVKQMVKGMGDDVVESVGIKPPADSGTSESGGQQQNKPQDDQIKKMDARQKTAARKRYTEIQEEIKQLQVKRQQDMVKYRQPGFTDEQKQKNQVKQLEEKKEDKLPPLPAQRASQKTEKMRGVSG